MPNFQCNLDGCGKGTAPTKWGACSACKNKPLSGKPFLEIKETTSSEPNTSPSQPEGGFGKPTKQLNDTATQVVMNEKIIKHRLSKGAGEKSTNPMTPTGGDGGQPTPNRTSPRAGTSSTPKTTNDGPQQTARTQPSQEEKQPPKEQPEEVPSEQPTEEQPTEVSTQQINTLLGKVQKALVHPLFEKHKQALTTAEKLLNAALRSNEPAKVLLAYDRADGFFTDAANEVQETLAAQKGTEQQEQQAEEQLKQEETRRQQQKEQAEIERKQKEQEELERKQKEQEEIERQQKEQEELERQQKEQEEAARKQKEQQQLAKARAKDNIRNASQNVANVLKNANLPADLEEKLRAMHQELVTAFNTGTDTLDMERLAATAERLCTDSVLEVGDRGEFDRMKLQAATAIDRTLLVVEQSMQTADDYRDLVNQLKELQKTLADAKDGDIKFMEDAIQHAQKSCQESDLEVERRDKLLSPQQRETRGKNKEVRQAMEDLNKTIESATKEEKQALAESTCKAVTRMKDEQLAQLSPKDQIQLLAQLQCHKTVTWKNSKKVELLPEEQREALAKVYGAIRLDKDFRGHNDQLRAQVLEQLVADKELVEARGTWSQPPELAENEAKKALLQKAQTLQATVLGFDPMPPDVQFEVLKDGSSGVCRGKQVVVSPQPPASDDFDEVMDTVIHETTHAYQRVLTDKLDSGELGVDDPRYAQAWLFKLNFDAYADPPDRSLEATDRAKYDADYNAYKRQPTEEHAWKAGNEAGRAFDTNAQQLALAGQVADLGDMLAPEKTEEANQLLKQFEGEKSVMARAEVLLKIDAIADEAYENAAKAALGLYPSIGNYVVGGFEKYRDEYNAIRDLKANPRKKLPQMSQLVKTLTELTQGGERDKNILEELTKQAGTLVSSMSNFVQSGYDTYNNKWKAIQESKDSLQQKIVAMTALKEGMEKLASSGNVDQEAYDKADGEVRKLCKDVDNYIVGGFKKYEQERFTIARWSGGISDKLQKMATLQKTLEDLAKQGKADQEAYDELVGKVKRLTDMKINEKMNFNNVINNMQEKMNIADRLKKLQQSAYGQRAATL